MLTTAEAHLLASSALLEDALDEPSHEAVADSRIPSRIGRYRIRRVIGSGGMGSVYEAEQDHPRRTVAVKLIRPGAISRSALARFRFEAEVLGRLQHPGIARIYEAGTHDASGGVGVGGAGGEGVPYFVMEYIAGAVPITEYARDRGLDLRERLALFAKVCDAVHYGHQKGIIHRDLKPENIVVGKAGGESSGMTMPGRSHAAQPTIIDFGVARATDADVAFATQITFAGQIIGTVQYMSPEQCDGDAGNLDMRSDVYSLGVVLYELLSDRLPYELKGTSVAAAARIVQEREPLWPSAVVRKLRGDVETIVLKAIEKDREKRYQSAAELAADIRRYLSGEPIAARAPGNMAKLGRCARRHPIIVTAAVCLLMVAATAVGTMLSVHYLRQRPYAIRLSPQSTEVHVISVMGDSLRTWRSDQTLQAVGPLEAAGGSVAVIGRAARDSTEHAPLAAYRTTDRSGPPLWSMAIRDDELPDELIERGFRGDEFGVTFLGAFDIFPESPGREIVAAFGHWMFSHAVVRVIDTSGNVLFQFWHDGAASAITWLAEPGLLVAMAVNGEAYWRQREVLEDFGRPHPDVLFAVRPVHGRVERDWLRTHSGDGDFAAVWYKAMRPQTAQYQWRRSFPTLVPAARNRREFAVQFTFSHDDRSAITWVFDEHGNVIPGSLIRGDGFNQWPDAPDPDLFIPIDLPPILPEYQGIAGPGKPGVPIGRGGE